MLLCKGYQIFWLRNHPEEKCNPPATCTILFENTEAKQDQLIQNYKNMIKMQQATVEFNKTCVYVAKGSVKRINIVMYFIMRRKFFISSKNKMCL